jgi:hypothetical protein
MEVAVNGIEMPIEELDERVRVGARTHEQSRVVGRGLRRDGVVDGWSGSHHRVYARSRRNASRSTPAAGRRPETP